MATLTLPNIGAYSAQVAVLVALATTLAWALRIDAASVRYGYWRTIFALCLLLPVLQGRRVPGTSGDGIVTESVTLGKIDAPAGLSSSLIVDWTTYVVPVIAMGIVLRLLWLAVSFARLRSLKRAGEPAPEADLRAELEAVIGIDCGVRYVKGLRQPATFGWLRPVILVPEELAERSSDVQRAVLSHELFHVKRRDWVWLVIEEITCAVLWFNPAVWWMVSRVQLARELVVDELAVLATGRRRAYVEALMQFTEERAPVTVAAFGGRNRLFQRIVLLTKEAGMSSRRLVFTCAVVAAALGAGMWHTVRALPLTAAGQQLSIRQISPGPFERRAKPITAENPIPRRTNYESAAYPIEARAVGASGSVTLMITLDELGRVVEARGIQISVASKDPAGIIRLSNASNPDEKRLFISQNPGDGERLLSVASALDDAAVYAVAQWRYEPPAAAPISFPVVISFSQNADASAGVPEGRSPNGLVRTDGALRIGGAIKTPVKIHDVRPVYPPEALENRVSGMVIVEARVAEDGTVEDARVLRSIPMLDQAAINAVMQWRFQPTLLNGKAVPVIMTVTVNFVVPPKAKAEEDSDGRRGMPAVLREVKPTYPREAQDAGVAGTVEMEVTVEPDGTVGDARVTRSIPLLDASAIEAVRQWKFTPVPQRVAVNIEMTFALRPDKQF